MKTKPITHRCGYSVCQSVSIRQEDFAGKMTWAMRKTRSNHFGKRRQFHVAFIKYCPFCGERLDYDYFDDKGSRFGEVKDAAD